MLTKKLSFHPCQPQFFSRANSQDWSDLFAHCGVSVRGLVSLLDCLWPLNFFPNLKNSKNKMCFRIF